MEGKLQRKPTRFNPNPPIDMTGKKINMLTVMCRAESQKGRTMWHCKCDCGNEIDVWYAHLKKGQYSCGCARSRLISEKMKTHGMSDTKIFGLWRHMKERCYKKSHKSYKDYGGRGIQVCDEWINNFVLFYEWAIANGYDENADFMQCTLDRIDVNGNYEPSNCRFISMKEQCNNRRNNRFISYNGEVHTIAEWSEKLHMKYCTISWRLNKGWDVEEILGFKKHTIQRKKTKNNEKTHYDEYRLEEA